MWKTVSDMFDGLYKVCLWLSCALMTLLCGLVLYSIFARIFGVYAAGATDVAGYVMISGTFTALAYTFRSHGHIRVSLLLQNLATDVRRWFELFCLAFMTVVVGYLAYYMFDLFLDSYEFGERSEGADAILLWIPQLPVAIGAFLFFLAVFHTFVEAIIIGPQAEPEKKPNEEF